MRSRWQAFLPVAMLAFGLIGLFALFEGNVGTLYRHRAMNVVAPIAVLAGPSLVALVFRIASLLAALRRPEA